MCLIQHLAAAKHNLKQLQDLAEEMGGDEDLQGNAILFHTKQIVSALNSIAELTTKNATGKGISLRLPESDYNKLVKAHNLIVLLTQFSSSVVTDNVTLSTVALTESLSVIENLSEAVFSAETIRNGGATW